MSTTPLVSVCIPTFNGERFIEETLKSVIDQDYPSLEILISDHSSSDRTRELVENFVDNRIKIKITTAGGGAERNWNAAVLEARGKYVKVLCQDDILKSTCISQQVEALENFPDCSFCFSNRDILTPRGRRILKSRGFSPASPRVYFQDELQRLVRSGTNIFGEPCAVLIRTTSLKQVPPFKGAYLIDLNMWISLWELGPAVCVPKALSQFRISKDSWTSELDGEQTTQIEEGFRLLMRSYPNLIDDHDVNLGIKRAKKLERNRRRLTRAVELLRL